QGNGTALARGDHALQVGRHRDRGSRRRGARPFEASSRIRSRRIRRIPAPLRHRYGIGLMAAFMRNRCPMKLMVKICGLTTEDGLDAAIGAGADMVGFVFFPPSPRYLTMERATALAARARGRAEIVALTVDMTDRGLEDIVDNVRPDWLQLHGNEAP